MIVIVRCLARPEVVTNDPFVRLHTGAEEVRNSYFKHRFAACQRMAVGFFEVRTR